MAVMYSKDGLSYKDLDEIRVVAFNTDTPSPQVNIALTYEGIIVDIVDRDTGEVIGTSSETFDEIVDRLTGGL